MNMSSFLAPLVLLSQNTPAPQLRDGSYLQVQYLRSVKLTKSPYKSIRDGGLLQFDITREDGRLVLTTIANFHDTGGTYRLTAKGTFLRDGGLDPTDTLIVSPTKGSTFRLNFPKDLVGEFEYVGSVDDFLRAYTIAGDYLDSRGKRYIFATNGDARFPDRVFKYKVGSDHFESPFDYLYGDGFDWAFKVDGNTLKLYNHTDEGTNSKLESRPFLTLQRIQIR